MKRTDLKEKSSVFFIAKWIIFLGIISTASLSFILGFFVGKSYRPDVERQALVTPSHEVSVQKNTGNEQKESSVQQPQQEMQAPTGTRIPQETKQIADMQQTRVTQQTKGIEKPSTIQENKNDRQIQKTGGPRNSSTARKYTIQIGAFKNSSDAKALKTKFEKKGYKTSLITVTPKKHENLYKVMVGEFTTREEAELVSIKIKNAEGLKTFVTYKEEAIR